MTKSRKGTRHAAHIVDWTHFDLRRCTGNQVGLNALLKPWCIEQGVSDLMEGEAILVSGLSEKSRPRIIRRENGWLWVDLVPWDPGSSHGQYLDAVRYIASHYSVDSLVGMAISEEIERAEK